jgi:4-carboxymuconolactone decarboxylase
MTIADQTDVSLSPIDDATLSLVRLAATIAAGSEGAIREAMVAIVDVVDPVWVEEVILQSYLFAGFPRTLNAAREWRRISGLPAPKDDRGAHIEHVREWQAEGEVTCATVYGVFYEQLRRNIRTLHPALDSWMVVDGYGKVLSRPGLDLKRRELCVVAICAAARQDRQLHSHLHGALNAGASAAEVAAALAAVDDMLSPDDVRRYRYLWARVLGK